MATKEYAVRLLMDRLLSLPSSAFMRRENALECRLGTLHANGCYYNLKLRTLVRPENVLHDMDPMDANPHHMHIIITPSLLCSVKTP